MTTVVVVDSIAAKASDVWDILGDFAAVKVGGPIEAFEIEGEGVGTVRTITMGGGKIMERLDLLDPDSRTFSYCIVNDDNPLPVSGYSAVVKIIEDGSDTCTVDWRGTFEPKGVDEASASKVVRGIYEGSIERARRALTR